MSSEDKFEERITVGDRSIVLYRDSSPIASSRPVGGADMFKMLDVFSDVLRPENYDKGDGAPMRLFTGESVRVDLSKRSVEDMAFWHRSADYNEIILCLKGALRWETELGETILHEGEMIWIPRGVAHRSALCEESAEENVLLELKIHEDLTMVVDNE